jgi:hypothetical protein
MRVAPAMTQGLNRSERRPSRNSACGRSRWLAGGRCSSVCWDDTCRCNTACIGAQIAVSTRRSGSGSGHNLRAGRGGAGRGGAGLGWAGLLCAGQNARCRGRCTRLSLGRAPLPEWLVLSEPLWMAVGAACCQSVWGEVRSADGFPPIPPRLLAAQWRQTRAPWIIQKLGFGSEQCMFHVKRWRKDHSVAPWRRALRMGFRGYRLLTSSRRPSTPAIG